MIDINAWLKSQQQNTKLKRFDLELLLLGALKVERSWLFSHADEHLTEDQVNTLKKWVKEAQEGKPIAYILGHQAFWTLDLLVTQDTLIPRPETEQIIELALVLEHRPNNLLDLGTGTGAIALSLAKEWPESQVQACDLSKAALAVAEKNAVRNHIENASFFYSDWFSAVPKNAKFDLIVSNPPYIDPQDHHLADLAYEPISALTADNKGLSDLEKLANQAKNHLKSKATLMLEHGYDQGPAVREILKAEDYKNVITHKDLAGHDRITVAQKA
ncbi:peptide chain release factor N(5)-glutamine methyltransferase [Marinicella rhabdoformis]|uniref:peptide chain release factor N(5)-glutamine methyltransferase n=1 Tax=Marinicella rhabdoformis TaxID=2580566 RepID=UPI0012AEDF45|nr:peptide chain release factor N(5)-glutamine methyltransferase [Marinicella rhabdoformis]